MIISHIRARRLENHVATSNRFPSEMELVVTISDEDTSADNVTIIHNDLCPVASFGAYTAFTMDLDIDIIHRQLGICPAGLHTVKIFFFRNNFNLLDHDLSIRERCYTSAIFSLGVYRDIFTL